MADRGAATDFGAALRRRRTAALLTQEQLAERAGLSVRTVRDLERGRVRFPRPESLRLLAEVLGLAGPELAGFEALGRSHYWAERAAAESGAPVAAPGSGHPTVPAQLPADVAGFTGRSELVGQLDALLDAADTSAVPITVLAGAPGVGKTALAVHWAHRIRHRFPDGQLYLNLMGYSAGPPLSPMEALTRLLRGLDVAPDRVPVDEAEAAALLRSLLADTRTLLVLDDARQADQVRPLLPGGPGCVVLVTSRSALRGLVARDGARRLTLEALAPDDSVALLNRLLGAEQAAAEAEAIPGLARLCGHLPLALRIAAANVVGPGGHSVAAFAERLQSGNRLAELAVSADADTMVRGAFDLSYQALPAETRRLFRVLSVAPGREVTPATAAALLGAPSGYGADLLGQLAGAHLVEQPTPGRYSQPDLLRLYAAERLTSEDGADARTEPWERLLEHYLGSLDEAARALYPDTMRLARTEPADAPDPVRFADHRQAMAWIDAELPALQAAVLTAAETGPARYAWLLADALRGYFQLRGTVLPWHTVAAAALSAAEAAGDGTAQAMSHLSTTGAFARQDRYGDAIRHGEQTLTLAVSAGWVGGEIAAHRALGNLCRLSGRLDRATVHLEQALALVAPSDRATYASIIDSIAMLNHERGRLDEAAARYRNTLELLRESVPPVPSKVAQVLADLADVLNGLGRSAEAMDHLEGARALQRERGEDGQEAYILRCQAEVHRDAGRLEQALELVTAAARSAVEADDLRLQAQVGETLASVHLAAGRYDEAAAHFDRALVLAGGTDNRYTQAKSLTGISSAHTGNAQGAQALAAAEGAVDIARRGGYVLLEGQALTASASALLLLGRVEDAVGHARAAVAAHETSGYVHGQVKSRRVLDDAVTRAGVRA